MSKKTPKLFRKKLTEKKWNKKIHKNIHIPKDRKFIEALYENQNGKMVFTGTDLNKDDRKKLKALAKSIKKNKGMVTRWKAGILMVILSILLLFNFFFKNTVVEYVLEKSLEEAFSAAAEIENLDISLSKGTMTFDSLRVQNRKDPGRNIFETTSSRLAISVPEIAKGRFRIQEFSVQGIQMDTARESDELRPSMNQGESKDPIYSMSDLQEDTQEQIKALLEEKKGNLQTLTYLENADEEMKAFTQKWESTFSDTQEKGDALIDEYSSIVDAGVPEIGSIQEGQALAQEYNNHYRTIQQAIADAKALNTEFSEEKGRLSGSKNEIERLILQDSEYIKGFLRLPNQSEVKDFVGDAIQDVLQKRFENYYDKAMLLFPVYEKWQAEKRVDGNEKKDRNRLAGKTLSFAQKESPRFLIEKMNLSGGNEQAGEFLMNLSGISSEPEKWSEPIQLISSWNEASTKVKMEGFVDLKENAEELFNLNFESLENKVPWEDGVPSLGIDSVLTSLSYSGTGRSHPEKEGILLSLDMDFSDIELMKSGSNKTISNIIEETMNEVESFLVSPEIHISKQGIESIIVSSDIDRIIQRSLGDFVKDLPQKGQAEVEAYLREDLAKQLSENEKTRALTESLNQESLDQLEDLKQIETRMLEYKQQIIKQGEELLEDQAKDGLETLKDSTKGLKLPGF